MIFATENTEATEKKFKRHVYNSVISVSSVAYQKSLSEVN